MISLFKADSAYYGFRPKVEVKDKEHEEAENLINQKILDSIIDDDEKKFTELICEICNGDSSKANQTFKITNYKFPDILNDNPTYISLCAFFRSEKCFTALTTFYPDGILSEELKKLDDFKRSPIHFACIGGSLNIIRELESAQYDLNAKDRFDYLPSHYASMGGHLDVVKYLFTKGADITSPSTNTNISPLEISCLYGNLDIVKFIYEVVLKSLKQQQEQNKSENSFFSSMKSLIFHDKKTTPLHYACIGGHDNIVNYILSNVSICGFQKDAVDNDSRTPLLCACHNGSLSCVKVLLNSENKKIKLDMKNKKHLALVDAAEGGHLDVIQYLLSTNKIDIHQETSECISALQAAVMNDHLNVVKFLVDKGAAKNLQKDKIAQIFLYGLKTENIKLICYLDKIFNSIPYNEKYQIEKVSTRSNYKYREAVKKNESKNLTYGDVYMQQACFLRNKKMTNFLLHKNCNFDNLDVTKIIECKAFKFFGFLIRKGYDINCSNNPSIVPPIVTIMKFGKISLIEKFISLGAVLNNEIILKYKCIEKACHTGNIELFNYLMSYKLNLQVKDINSALNNVIIHYVVIDKYKDEKEKADDCLTLIDSLLSIQKIDLNSPIYEKSSSCTFISVAAEKNKLKLLQLFKKHGADFSNSALNFDEMIGKDFMPVYNFLKENGCKFDKRIFKYGSASDSNHTYPLLKILCNYIRLGYHEPDTLVFLLDFSSPKQIIEAEYRNKNLIDVFMDANCFNGVEKAFLIIKGVLYPLSNDKQDFQKWIRDSSNKDLIDLVFNSKLPIIENNEEKEDYEDPDEEEDFYHYY